MRGRFGPGGDATTGDVGDAEDNGFQDDGVSMAGDVGYGGGWLVRRGVVVGWVLSLRSFVWT